MRNTILALMLISAPLAWPYDLPSHWPTPLTTEQVEMLKQKQDIVDAIADRMKLKPQFVFLDTHDRMIGIGQIRENGWLVSIGPFAMEVSIQGVIEVLGLIEQNRDKGFDLSKFKTIKPRWPVLQRADGSYYRPNDPSEIKDPKARAEYIAKVSEIKLYYKRYPFEYELKKGSQNWMESFLSAVYSYIPNKKENAVDREKVKVVYELVRTANITEQSKQKLRFWLTMMVECDKSLVKKAREENDQTCANYVKELHGDSSVGDSSGGNAQRHKRS